jgi:glycosyltransferase involved in cell wall biosynthesis
MRILQIFSRYRQFGGEEASVRNIREALRSRHKLEVFFGSTAEMLGKGAFDTIRAPLKVIWNREVYRKLRAMQAAQGFDIWLVHNVFPGLSPAVYDAARLMDVPVVQYLHNYRFACVNGFLLNHGEPCVRCLNGNFFPAVQTRCWHESRIACGTMGVSLVRLRTVGVFKQMAHWIAISQAQKAIHVRIGIPEEKISVLHHFYDGPKFNDRVLGRDVLFVGRLSPEKGAAILVDAWLQSGINDRRLWIVGDGPIRAELEATARNRPDIIFAGFLSGDQLRERWLNAALTVVPSIWEEAFGRILIESWAHGVPVLAARIGALPELVGATGAGWLFEPSSPTNLAYALRSILTDETAFLTVAAKCREAASRFSKEKWLTAIEGILDVARSRTVASRTCAKEASGAKLSCWKSRAQL